MGKPSYQHIFTELFLYWYWDFWKSKLFILEWPAQACCLKKEVKITDLTWDWISSVSSWRCDVRWKPFWEAGPGWRACIRRRSWEINLTLSIVNHNPLWKDYLMRQLFFIRLKGNILLLNCFKVNYNLVWYLLISLPGMKARQRTEANLADDLLNHFWFRF